MRKTNDQQILQMLQEGVPQKEIARVQGVSRAAVCKRVKLLSVPESVEALTDKQAKFVDGVAKGLSNTEAALKAFDCKNRESAKQIGMELMARKDIEKAVADVMQEQGLTKGYRVWRLKSHVDNQNPEVSLRALDQSWKLSGDYAPDRHLVATFSFSDSMKSLEELDRELEELQAELALPSNPSGEIPAAIEAEFWETKEKSEESGEEEKSEKPEEGEMVKVTILD